MLKTNVFGLGILLGQPTGISAKYWTSGSTAFDFGLGYSFEKHRRMYLHADSLFHSQSIFKSLQKYISLIDRVNFSRFNPA